MSWLGAAWQAWTVGQQTTHAVAAAKAVLAAEGSPVAALEAFAAETGSALDDAAVAELRVALQQATVYLELGVRVALALSTALADPQVAKMLTNAIRTVGDGGYRLAMWQTRLNGWLKEA